MRTTSRILSRVTAALAALSMAACAATPGPLEQRAAQAGAACNAGHGAACAEHQSLYPAVAAERQQRTQDAQVGTAVAAGALGLAAGALLASSGRPGGYRHYGYRYYR